MAYEEKYMKMAIDIARDGIRKGCGGPFGCVIVRKTDGKVLAKTHNTVVSTKDPTAHGEVNAIREACRNIQDFRLDDCEMYTSSEPCPMCMGAIMWARIPVVYSAQRIEDAADIGFDDEPFYAGMEEYGSNKKNAFVEVRFVDSEDGRALFEEYKNMEHVKY